MVDRTEATDDVERATAERMRREQRSRRGWRYLAPLAAGIAMFAAFVFAAPATAGPPDGGEGAAETTVSGLKVDQNEEGTYLRVQSSDTPSFSVFKLEEPLRLVLDISNSALEGNGTMREIDNGVISQVSLLETQKRSGARVRLIVGFEQGAHYDVRTKDDDVVVFVEGGNAESPKADADSERDDGTEEALEERRREVEKAKARAEKVRSELSEAKSRIDELRDKLEAAQKSSEKERLRNQVRKTESRVDSLERKLGRKSDEVASLEQEIAELEQRLSEQKSKAERRARQLEELRRQKQKWSKRLETRNNKVEEARAEIDRKEQRIDKLRADLEKLRREEQRADGEEKKRLQAKLEQRSSKLEELESELDSRRKTVESLREDVEQLKRERKEAREKIARVKSRWKERLQKRQKQYERANEKLESTRKRLERAQGEIEKLRERKADATGDEREKLERQLADKAETLRSVKKQLEKRQQAADKLRDRVADLEKKNSRRSEKLADYKERLSQRNDKISTLENRISDLRAKADRSDEQAERLERLEEKLAEQKRQVEKLERARAKLEERDRKISKLKSRLERIRRERKRARTEESENAETIEKLEARLERKEQQLAEMKKTREKRRERLAELKNQSEQAESETAGDGSEASEGEAARAVPMTGDEASGENEGTKPNEIEDIRLRTKNGTSQIIVELDEPGAYKRLPRQNSRAVMLLKNVELPDDLEQTIAAGESGALRFVSSFSKSGDKVRMEAELDESARERIHQEGDKLVWEFAPKVAEGSSSKARAAHKDEADGKQGPRRAEQGKPERPEEGTSRTSAPPDYPRTVVNPAKVDRVPGMSRKRLSVDLRGADIGNVLRLFAKEGGVNIIAGDDVEGDVTLTLKEVPLDEAFLIVLQSQSLGFEKRGSVVRVATQEKLREERQARIKAKRQKQKAQPLEVFLMPVNYADADALTDQVKRLLSPRGSVSVDERTNTLIIKDLAQNIRSIRELVSELDSQVPQVLIEARIVETNDTFSQEFGIQWGGDFSASQAAGNPTGLIFPNVIGAAGGATDSQTPTQGSSSNPNFAVNLPAAAGTGTGGALGLTLGSIAGIANLNLRLSAAEEKGRAKIVSAPKILTLDNQEATISQGTSIPISVVSAAGVQTVFVDATLELTVTPHVTPNGKVQMSLEVSKNEPDFQNTGARGDPTIIRKQAETSLLIEDGETTVIGGIYTRNTGQSITGIPVLHRIPILGQLFKNTSQSERRTELLIFLTPRVVNRAKALNTGRTGNVVEGAGGAAGGNGSSGDGGGN